MRHSVRADAVIIGGGVIGVASALYLARKGRRVVLLERGGIASGCSYGNAGLICPSHSVPLAAPGAIAKGIRFMGDPESPFYIRPRLSAGLFSWLWRFALACRLDRVRRAAPLLLRLHRESLALYEALARDEGIDFGFERKGLLYAFATEKGLAEGREEARLAAGGEGSFRVLDAGQVRAIEPLLKGIAGGILHPEDAHLAPDRFVHAGAVAAGKAGAQIRTETEVMGFAREGRRIAAVETTRGTFEADEVVLAAGAWSPEIARGLGLRLPIQPAKGYSITGRPAGRVPSLPILLAEAKVAVTPLGNAVRFAGTLELAGMDLSIDRRRVEAIARAAARHLEGMEPFERTEVWRGLRPCTPDGLPYVGRPKRWDNLVVAAGHAMIGISLGPVTGRLVAEIACREPPFADTTLLDPDRYG